MANLNVGITATDKTGKAFNAVNRNVQALEKGFGSLKGVIAGAFAVGSITAFTNKMLDFADRVHKVSLQVGLGAEALQKFQFAGEQSGVSAEKLNKSLQKLAINAGKATDGSKVQAEAFEKLGVQITDVNGVAKPLEEILFKVATGIKNLKDPTEKAETAVRLFGGAGAELLPFLNEGETGLRLLGMQLEAYGGVLTQDAIDQSAAFNDEINKLSKTFRVIFGEVVLPIVNKAFLGLKRLFLLATTGDPFSLMEKSTKTLQKEVNALLKRNEELNETFKKQSQALKNQNLKHYERENITKNALRTDKERLENIEKITAIQEILNLKTGVTVIDYAEIDKNVENAKKKLNKTNEILTDNTKKTNSIKKNTEDIADFELEIVNLKSQNDTRYSNLIEHTITYESELNNVKNSWQNITGLVETAQGNTEDLSRFFKDTGSEVKEVIEPSIRTVDEIASNYKKNSEDLSRFFIKQGEVLETKIEPKIISVDQIASNYRKTLDEISNKFLPKEVTEYEKAVPIARTLDELAESRRNKLLDIANKFAPKQVTEAEKAVPIARSIDELAQQHLNKIRDQTHQFRQTAVVLTEEEKLFNKILTIAEKTNAVTSKFSKSLSGSKTQLKDLAKFFTPIVSGIQAGASAVGGFLERQGGAILQAGGKSGQRALTVGKEFATKGVEAGIMALVLSNEKVQEALGKVFDALFELIDPIIDLLAPILEELVEIIVELKPLFELLIPIVREQLRLLRPLINALKFVAGILGKVGSFLQSLKSPLEVLKQPLIGLKGAIDALSYPLNELKKAIQNIGGGVLGIGGGGGGGLIGAITSGVKSVASAFGFADGGTVRGGRTILVGEKGPELFTPPSNGTIIPNHELGGGQTVVNVYLDMEGQVKLPLHQYISSVVNNANRSGQPELATVLAG